jgi:hypothetical protein
MLPIGRSSQQQDLDWQASRPREIKWEAVVSPAYMDGLSESAHRHNSQKARQLWMTIAKKSPQALLKCAIWATIDGN